MTATAPVWGDGFADETWTDIVRTRSLDDYADDELIRFFPNAGRAGAPAMKRLHAMVATRLASQRGRRRHTEDAKRIPSMPIRLWRFLQQRRPASRDALACEDRALAFLSTMMPRLESAAGGGFDPALATTFAFHAGLHPAYVWPEALLSHERETAAGWLGLLSRGRPALVPLDVADYLVDILKLGACGSFTVTDGTFGVLLREAGLDLKHLHGCLQRRIRGDVFVMRRGSMRPVERSRPGILVSAHEPRAERVLP